MSEKKEQAAAEKKEPPAIRSLKMAIAKNTGIKDQEVLDWLAYKLHEIIAFLQMAPTSMSTGIILMILDLLPPDVATQVVAYHVRKMQRLYTALTDAVRRVMPRTQGRGDGLDLMSLMLELIERMPQTQQQQPQRIEAQEAPEDLKKLIRELENEAEN